MANVRLANPESLLLNLRVSPNTVQKQTVEKLREAIITGVFKPGQRLVEAQLCNLLGVSRPSVREALRSLEAERLIANVPNRGIQIPIVTWSEAEQIYHVRTLLEGEAAALCAQRVQAKDLTAMKLALEEFASAIAGEDRPGLLKSTAAFYDAVLHGCGNDIIKEILSGLLARISFLRDRSMSRKGRAKLSLREMQSICSAIENRDSAAARRAAIAHVKKAFRAAQESYAEDGALQDSRGTDRASNRRSTR